MLTRHLARVMVPVAVLAGGLAVTAGPAQAAWAQCPEGSFCVWVDANATGKFAYFNDGSSDLRRPIGGYVFDNRITAIWNRSEDQWCVYDNPGYGGRKTGLGIGGRGNLPATLNDKISSLTECF
jgi:hypothetical protein